MRIVCPHCDAAYEVPETALAPGRPVRCARCGQDWAPVASPAAPSPAAPSPASSPLVAPPPAGGAAPAVEAPGPALDLRRVRSQPVVPLPPAPGEPAPTVVAPAPPPAAAAPAPRAAPRVQAPVLAGWVLSVLVLLGAAWAAYAWRADIMQAWPPSTRLYTLLGLTGG